MFKNIRKKDKSDRKFYHEDEKQINIIRRKNHRAYHLHTHEFEEILLVLSGHGVHFHNNEYDFLLPGSCFYIKSGERHSFSNTNKLNIINIGFYANYWSIQETTLASLILKFQDLLVKNNRKIHLTGQVLNKIEEIIRWLEMETAIERENNQDQNKNQNQEKENNNILITSLFTQLFYLITRTNDTQVYHRDHYNNINDDVFNLLKIYKFASDDINQDNISIKQYAKDNGRTYNTFLRHFISMVGLPPKDVESKIKLYNSRNLILRHPTWSISKIAIQSGFEDISYFSKLFKKEFDLAPKKYALQNKSNIS